jgi:transcriptional regulator with XRE-family HTH domain
MGSRVVHPRKSSATVKTSGAAERLSLSTEVVQYLRNNGRTLEQVGKLIGTNKSFVSRVASGQRNLTIDHLLRIERALGEPLLVLLLEARHGAVGPRRYDPKYAKLLELLRASWEGRREP